MPTSLETLLSYTPSLVQRYYAQQPESAPSPRAEQYMAALLVLELDGVIPLVEAAHQTAQGEVHLSVILNDYVSQLLEGTAAHGGEVLKISGNMLFIGWLVGVAGRDLENVTRRAAACALALKQQVQFSTTMQNSLLILQNSLSESQVETSKTESSPLVALNLGHKALIDAGSLWTATVGGVEGHWQFLIAGPILGALEGLLSHAKIGDVFVTSSAWQGLVAHARGEVVGRYVKLQQLIHHLKPRPLQPITALSPQSISALRSYVSPIVLAQLELNYPQWLTALPQVSVLYLNIGGLLNRHHQEHKFIDNNTAIQQWLMLTQDALYDLQHIINQLGGCVIQYYVDEKGSILTAAWGIPLHQHSDNAVRAVRAAIQAYYLLKEQQLSASIGVATGAVFYGNCGNSTRRQFDLIGNATVLADYLMQVADDDIICDSNTYQQARPYLALTGIKFERLVSIKMTGRILATYRPLLSEDAHHSFSFNNTDLIGRQQEVHWLTQQLLAFQQSGQGGRIILEGELGSGKTRLITEVVQQALYLGIQCIIVSGTEKQLPIFSVSPPYAIWQSLLAQLLQIVLGDTTWAEVTAHLKKAPIANDLEILRWLLPLELEKEDNDSYFAQQLRHPDTHAQLRVQHLQAAILRLLQYLVAQSPQHFLFIIEDAHALDSSSYPLLTEICEQLTTVMLLIVTRLPVTETPTSPNCPAPLDDNLSLTLQTPLNELPSDKLQRLWLGLTSQPSAELERIKQQNMTKVLTLMPLDAENIAKLVNGCLWRKNLPAVVTRWLQEKARGNPLLAENLARVLKESGALALVNHEPRLINAHVFEQWNSHLLNENTPTVPTLWQILWQVTRQRLQYLTLEQRQLLQIASVIGTRFTVNTLQLVATPPLEIPPLNPQQSIVALEELCHLGLIERFQFENDDTYYYFNHPVIRLVIYQSYSVTQRQQAHANLATWYQQTQSHEIGFLAQHFWLTQQPQRAIPYLQQLAKQAFDFNAHFEAVLLFTHLLDMDKPAHPAEAADRSTASNIVPFPKTAASANQMSEWQTHLGISYSVLGKLPHSREALETALSTLKHPVPRQLPHLWWTWCKAIAHDWLQQHSVGRKLLTLFRRKNQPVSTPEILENLAQSSLAYEWLAHVMTRTPPAADATWIWNKHWMTLIYARWQAVNLAEKLISQADTSPTAQTDKTHTPIVSDTIKLHYRPLLARAYSHLGQLCNTLSWTQTALYYQRQASNLVNTIEHLPSIAAIESNTAQYEMGQGRWERCHHHLLNALRAADQVGDYQSCLEQQHLLAIWYSYQGAFQDSVQHAQNYYQRAKKQQNLISTSQSLCTLAWGHLRLGDIENAVNYLKMVQNLPNPDALPLAEAIRVCGVLTLVYARQDLPKQAIQMANKTAHLLAKMPPLHVDLFESYAAVATVYLQHWENHEPPTVPTSLLSNKERDAFNRLSQRACEQLANYAKAFPIAQARTLWLQGRLSWLQGEAVNAQKQWRAALETATRFNMAYEQGLAHFEIARHGDLSHPIMQKHLQMAEQIFKQLGVEFELQQVLGKK